MEVPGGKNNKILVCLYEAIGTFYLLLAVNMGADYQTFYGAVSVGITVMAIVILFGPVCGAHYNPAVTTGVLIREGLTLSNIWYSFLIITSQLIGATCSVLTVTFMQKKKYGRLDPGVALLCPHN